MVSAAAMFQPGWVLRTSVPGGNDPVTGNPRPPTWQAIRGTGMVQAPTFGGMTEVGATGVRDERLVLFRPLNGAMPDVKARDEFTGPDGRMWQCAGDGLERSIPGHPPDYLAVPVRRAREKEVS